MKVHAFIPNCKTHYIAIIGEPVECKEEKVHLNWNQFSLHGAAVAIAMLNVFFASTDTLPIQHIHAHTACRESWLRVYMVK